MSRPKGSLNKKKKIKDQGSNTWKSSSESQFKDSILLEGATDAPQPPQRDEKGKFLPGHKATRNVRNPFKKLLDSIILENPENLKKFEQTVSKLLNKCADGEIQAIGILFKYLMPGIAEHGLEAIGKIRTSTAAELSESMDKVIGHMAEGEISPEAANSYLRCLSAKREFMQITVIEEKVNMIEQRLSGAGK